MKMLSFLFCFTFFVGSLYNFISRIINPQYSDKRNSDKRIRRTFAKITYVVGESAFDCMPTHCYADGSNPKNIRYISKIPFNKKKCAGNIEIVGDVGDYWIGACQRHAHYFPGNAYQYLPDKSGKSPNEKAGL